MISSQLAITLTGFLAQAFFSARILVQWIMSERARRVISPSVFWVLSLAGSWLLCLYGWLRCDFAIVLGQLVSYYIYLWNLKIKGVWGRVPLAVRLLLMATPLLAMAFVAADAADFAKRFLHNADVPMWMLLYGSLGQLIFTLRFVCQWISSRRAGRSQLPTAFWLLSLAGSAVIVSYGFMRSDVVLIVGQSFGIIAYIRNLSLLLVSGKQQKRIK